MVIELIRFVICRTPFLLGGWNCKREINIYEEKGVEFVNVFVVCIAEVWSVNESRKKEGKNRRLAKRCGRN